MQGDGLRADLPPGPVIPAKALKPWRALSFGALLFVVDAYVLNQGVLALIVAAAVILFVIPHALTARKYRGRRGQRLRNLAIVLLAVALVFAFIVLNNRMARERAEVLIAAVRNFRAVEQRYPLDLQELVPKYASGIPLAKYTFALNTFKYAAAGAAPTLSYTSLPPYGRRIYSFERGDWTFID